MAEPTSPEPDEVRAAGAVLWRRAGHEGVEVAVVHRPRYDDWSLPKGKLDPGEGWREAARREVREETGFGGEPGRELGSSHYEDRHGRPKRVRYWLMEASAGAWSPNEEVDELRWLGEREAAALLTHERDRELVHEAVAAAGWVRRRPGGAT